MKASHLLSFLCGALAVLGLGMVGQSKAESPKHVYELRVYHANPGKLQALITRFGTGTDKIFRSHNINSIGYWVPRTIRKTSSSMSLSIPAKPRPTKTGLHSTPIPPGTN